ncbi:hypothetical protein A9X06_35885 [Mycobacterium sp. 852002-51759_SCH5129042]|nr:hypothetical protein A9X06_35885 [Mycobacterium sp. 852002-51759_SCH5129042]
MGVDMRAYGIELFDRWTAMWNGEVELANRIMAPHFTLRYAQPGAEAYDSIHDPETFARPYGSRRPVADGEIAVSGTDILRVGEGLIVEVWSVSGGTQGRSYY